MKEKLLVATASVVVIAVTLSLLNIYVFPDIMFRVNVTRNTDNEERLDILYNSENIALTSPMFDSLNLTQMYADIPENAIMNITYMIEQVEAHESGAFDTIRQNYEEDYIIPSAKRIKMTYNGSILFASNNYSMYFDWIDQLFNGNASYFALINGSDSYSLWSNISSIGQSSFTLYGVKSHITNLYSTNETKPFYVIIQEVSYDENRGLLQSYNTYFNRLIFLNVFGDVLFFLSNEGYWEQPVSFI